MQRDMALRLALERRGASESPRMRLRLRRPKKRLHESAIAIAVHNVPEGLCVSVPIYYATRDRWEAFKWAFISGISEPIGAGLGWLVLYRTMDDNAYGVVFGLVAGMMINICISELLPTAFKYDPRDKIVTRCFVGGMAIMALSLVLFLNV